MQSVLGVWWCVGVCWAHTYAGAACEGRMRAHSLHVRRPSDRLRVGRGKALKCLACEGNVFSPLGGHNT